MEHQCSFLWSGSVAPAGTSSLGTLCKGLAIRRIIELILCMWPFGVNHVIQALEIPAVPFFALEVWCVKRLQDPGVFVWGAFLHCK